MDFFVNQLERLLDWLLIGSHPPSSGTLVVGLMVVLGVVVGVVLVWRRRPELAPVAGVRIDAIGDQVSAQARPLMDGPSVATFNLLLLAVREQFLLLSKIPVRSLVHLHVEDDSVRRVLAQNLRNVAVDFVAVHPGTRLPVKAMFVRRDDALASSAQEQLVEALFHQAGIEVIRLDQEARYSVEQLIDLLGLEEET